MHTSTVFETALPFRVGSFDPAVNLTEHLPRELDADILLLRCGDARHILYTAYAEQSVSGRKIDITACDTDPNVIARNALLFTLAMDISRGGGFSPEQLWSIWNLYYSLYLREPDINLLDAQTKKLLDASKTLGDWHASPYGATVRFCDQDTLLLVRDVWSGYVVGDESRQVDDRYQTRFEASLTNARRRRGTKQTSRQDVSRSCAPSAAQLAEKLLFVVEQHWETGRGLALPVDASSEAAVPNPVFAIPLLMTTLGHPIDPLLSFHLAVAHAVVPEKSRPPIHEGDGGPRDSSEELLAISLEQFGSWIRGFTEMARSDLLIIRHAAADCFSFCYTLRHNMVTGETCAQHYRGTRGFGLLELAESEYGAGAGAPRQFDVIDATTLTSEASILDLLLSAGSLLKPLPSSTLHTAGPYPMDDAGFEALLHGHTTTISVLLGIVPAEYWANAKTVALADEILMAWSDDKAEATLPRFRISWNQSKCMAGPQPNASLRADVDALVRLAKEVYHCTFAMPSAAQPALSDEDNAVVSHRPTTLHHHPGTVAAFLKAIAKHVQVDSTELCERFVRAITQPPAVDWVGVYLGAVALEVPTLAQELAQSRGWHKSGELGAPLPFMSWSQAPPRLAVTVVVDHASWKDLVAHGHERLPPTGLVAGYLRVLVDKNTAGVDFATEYPDIQIGFGQVATNGSREQDRFTLRVDEDRRGWKGDSPMVVSFYVPTPFLEGAGGGAAVGFKILPAPLGPHGSEQGFSDGTGRRWERPITDGHVFITRYRPGQTGYEVMEDGLRNLQVSGELRDEAPPETTVTADFDPGKPDIVSITGRLNIVSEQGRTLLADKAPIEVRQSSPFVLDVVFGKDSALVLPLVFPAPVLKEGSKTRIARKSGYVEITAPLANPSTFPAALDSYVLPTVLPTTAPPLPVPLNTPRVYLDSLPPLPLDDKSRIGFITTLASLMFSTRERRLREQTLANPDPGAPNSSTPGALSPSPRLNFKESLFTIFMLSAGLQGGQTGLFALSHPQRGGIHMLLFVSAVRLDAAHGSVVLDAAALPFTRALVDSRELDEFLLVLRALECCTLTVDDGELALWKRALPALAERCRDWEHRGADADGGCEYVRAGTAPVSLRDGEPVLCTCGQGRLPDAFLSLPEWETAARHATRVAISPVYASALVEELVAPELARAVAEEVQGKRGPRRACRNCGKTEDADGVRLKKCARCLAVAYCSPACQKRDWKHHRMECEEAEEHEK